MSTVRSTPLHSTRWKRQRDTRDEDVAPGFERMARFDLGLALLSIAVKPGHELTRYDIAAWGGVTDAAIYRVEKTALLKIRTILRFGASRGIWQEEA